MMQQTIASAEMVSDVFYHVFVSGEPINKGDSVSRLVELSMSEIAVSEFITIRERVNAMIGTYFDRNADVKLTVQRCSRVCVVEDYGKCDAFEKRSVTTQTTTTDTVYSGSFRSY